MKRSKNLNSWYGMHRRCSPVATGRDFKNYYERGIRVCKRWNSFANFLNDMGECPEGLTLDRINNNRGYSKANCRWATPKQQARNRRAPKRRYRGIYPTEHKTFQACISQDCCQISLGTFSTVREALEARKKAEKFYKYNSS